MSLAGRHARSLTHDRVRAGEAPGSGAKFFGVDLSLVARTASGSSLPGFGGSQRCAPGCLMVRNRVFDQDPGLRLRLK